MKFIRSNSSRRGLIAVRLVAPVALCSLALAACGGSDGGKSQSASAGTEPLSKKTAYLISCFDANPWCKEFNAEFIKKMSDGGVDVTLLQNAFDPVEEAQQFEQAISQQPGAIFVQAADGNAVVPSIKRAAQAGIPVVNLQARIADEGTDSVALSVVQDSEANGQTLAEQVQKALQDQGRTEANVIILNGVSTQFQMVDMWASFNKAMESTPEFKVVENVDALYDQAKAEALTTQLIAKYENKGGIAAIVTGGDGMTTGAIEAANKLDVPLGGDDGMIVVGGGCFPVALPNLESGDQYSSLDLTPDPAADFQAEYSLKLFNGEIKDDEREFSFASPVLDQSTLDTLGPHCEF
jgi:ribose transport system substrate-binding protein